MECYVKQKNNEEEQRETLPGRRWGRIESLVDDGCVPIVFATVTVQRTVFRVFVVVVDVEQGLFVLRLALGHGRCRQPSPTTATG